MSDNLFTRFDTEIDGYALPEKFTFPFYYQPHLLCELAVQQLQQHLATQISWQHDFGINEPSQTASGKMFGVLLVQNQEGEIGYLSAFSGKLADKNHLPGFVPPVFDMLQEEGFFKRDLAVITSIAMTINELEANPELSQLQLDYQQKQQAAEQAVSAHRSMMIEGRKDRKIRRAQAEKDLSEPEYLKIKEMLSKESIQHKNELRDLTLYWDEITSQAYHPLCLLLYEIEGLKSKRKQLSNQLQNKLFDHYRFLNISGDEQNLKQLFEVTSQNVPPAGAGECAAPKLLQYAFQHQLKPLAMAEFWWGTSPKSEIRQHKKFYGACQGKCQPILAHMLVGLDVEDNPLLANPAEDESIDIIYQDDAMLIINKPSGLLSVPGKSIEDSVYFRMKIAYPNVDSPLIVHRLDMSTSGLMVIALDKRSHKHLQKQFINRTVQKRYIAVLDGYLEAESGTIDLPLRVDLDDRPRQLVCYEYGRHAETDWQLIERKNNKTKVYFYPKTGRTHQLRVHSAHNKGLNTAIVGDDLYGHAAERLHLHAESLTLQHPVTRQTMTFQVDADF